MTLNPKLNTTQTVLGLVLAVTVGYWFWSAPMRSLASLSRWTSKHKADWAQVQEQNPNCRMITLGGGTQNRGTVMMIGFTYDEEAKKRASKFVLDRDPPGGKFQNAVRVVPKDQFDMMLENRKQDQQGEAQ